MEEVIARIEKVFDSNGLLANRLVGYRPRRIQIEMAQAVAGAIEASQVLIAEAGTGVGKTYAYLVPSLLSGNKVIVSTGTKNLQDQLFHRDIPLLRKALGIPKKINLLKGRSNYLCLHRLATYMETNFFDAESLHAVVAIKQWSERSIDGEIDHFTGKQPDAALMPYITSNADNCLSQECEFYSKCFLMKARRAAQEADLLIVNHHLFFADSQLKDSGIMDLLPDSDAIIFDEAHQLPEVASHFLGESLSGRQLIYLARDIEAELKISAPDILDVKVITQKLIHSVQELKNAFGAAAKGSWRDVVNKPQLKNALFSTLNTLETLQIQIEKVKQRSHSLENCWQRAQALYQRLKLLSAEAPKNTIHWYETSSFNFSIHHTPLTISDYFVELINTSNKAWIFTSATLSVGGDFSHFASHLGINKATYLALESPYNYGTQALLYLPRLTVATRDSAYTLEMIKQVVPVLRITRGRAFLLFTSHKALNEAAALLGHMLDYPLFVQGTKPKVQLLKEFTETENGVLLGTSSFWEGIDVKGSQLSCVVIDKIPFTSPDDPIFKARNDFYQQQGGSGFKQYQLPQAVISLRQGAGRLIRDFSDKGVLMLCDPRLLTKDYGKLFLQALPQMKRTFSLEEVSLFFQEACT